MTALLASGILRGQDLPPSSRLEFDWRELRRWGIDEARLPEGSVVLFREKTLWSEHGRAILAALALLVAQTLLIGALLVARRQRIGAQARLHEAEQRYRTVADFTHDWEFWRLPDETFAHVSPSCARLTGCDAAELPAPVIGQWGSGIQRMAQAGRQAGLPEPLLEEIGSGFRVTLRGERRARPDLDTLAQSVLDFVRRSPGGAPTSEIAAHIRRTPRATRDRIKRLVDLGLLAPVGTGPRDSQRVFRAIGPGRSAG